MARLNHGKSRGAAVALALAVSVHDDYFSLSRHSHAGYVMIIPPLPCNSVATEFLCPESQPFAVYSASDVDCIARTDSVHTRRHRHYHVLNKAFDDSLCRAAQQCSGAEVTNAFQTAADISRSGETPNPMYRPFFSVGVGVRLVVLSCIGDEYKSTALEIESTLFSSLGTNPEHRRT